MTSPSKPSPVIVLAAVDDTSVSEDVVRTAGGLASALPGAELHLLRVVAPPTPPIVGMVYVMASGPALTDLIAVAKEELANVAASTESFARPPICHVLAGPPGHEIVDLANKIDADLIVVGPHAKKALSRLVLGSVSEYVVRHAPCSVLVARGKEIVAAPQIEPPCPACIAAREATADVLAWCERHSKHHARATVHYEAPPSFGVGSMFIRPED